MAQTFESWYRSTLASKLNPADVTMTVATAPTVTKWRLFLSDWQQKEWISFTWVSWTTLTWLTRWLSQTADPATAWTWLTWIAWTEVILVAMHDNLPDRQEWLKVKIYADETARDADITSPENGMQCYVTSLWQFTDYVWWAWVSRASWTNPNASDTGAGKVEIATDSELTAWTDTWWSGATVVAKPSQLQKSINVTSAWTETTIDDWDFVVFEDIDDSNNNKKITKANLFLRDNNYIFWNWWDWAWTISSNTTLTKDMNYTSLTVNNWFFLNTDWYRVYVTWTLTNNWIIKNDWWDWTNGWDWSAWVSWWSGWTWWTAGSWNTLPAWVTGSDWWDWVLNTWNWNNWTAWTSKSDVILAENGSAWGSWWDTAWNTWWSGGAWWTTTQTTAYPTTLIPLTYLIVLGTNTLYNIASWWGWWWGGWTTNDWGSWDASGWWGAWWWSGWITWISSKVINNTATWIIQANGWNWGDWWDWTHLASWGAWWWWWGAWGCWWCVVLTYGSLTNSWTIQASWWSGWTWWTWSWTWVNGNDWTVWSAWDIFQLQI